MGFIQEKRPIFARGGIVASTNSTRTVGNIAASLVTDGANAVAVESLTGTDAAQTLSADGASFLTYGTSGISNDFIIPDPEFSGQVKYVLAVNNTTSIELNLNTAATSHTIWGTTCNTISCSAASPGGPGGVPAGTMALTLIAASTTQWAAFPGSTFNWDFTATTGSTSTPDP